VRIALIAAGGLLILGGLELSDRVPVASAAPASESAQDGAEPGIMALGEEVYLDQCLMCHGSEGRGDGPAARFEDPRPQDLTRDEWEFAVEKTPEAIVRVLNEGVDDTGMVSFSQTLTEEEIQAVAIWVHETIVKADE
jgi:mono/diheme cytochrome c family protein